MFALERQKKLILCKLGLEFLLSRCDTLIKLVISGLSQYTKAPKFCDFYPVSVFWWNDEKETPLYPVPRLSCS